MVNFFGSDFGDSSSDEEIEQLDLNKITPEVDENKTSETKSVVKELLSDSKEKSKEKDDSNQDSKESEKEKGKENEKEEEESASETESEELEASGNTFDQLYALKSVSELVSGLRERQLLPTKTSLLLLGVSSQYVKFTTKRDIFGFLTSLEDEDKQLQYKTFETKKACSIVNAPSRETTKELGQDFKQIFDSLKSSENVVVDVTKMLDEEKSGEKVPVVSVSANTPLVDLMLTEHEIGNGYVVLLSDKNAKNLNDAFNFLKCEAVGIKENSLKSVYLSGILKIVSELSDDIEIVNLSESKSLSLELASDMPASESVESKEKESVDSEEKESVDSEEKESDDSEEKESDDSEEKESVDSEEKEKESVDSEEKENLKDFKTTGLSSPETGDATKVDAMDNEAVVEAETESDDVSADAEKSSTVVEAEAESDDVSADAEKSSTDASTAVEAGESSEVPVGGKKKRKTKMLKIKPPTPTGRKTRKKL